MVEHRFWDFEVEVDHETTQRWYATKRGWSCRCVGCRNFREFLRKEQLPAFVLEYLDELGIPPNKPTYLRWLGTNEDELEEYEFSYRIAGNILYSLPFPYYSEPGKWPVWGRCLHEPNPRCAPKFPEPHFDLEFLVKIPWLLDEPKEDPYII